MSSSIYTTQNMDMQVGIWREWNKRKENSGVKRKGKRHSQRK